MHAWSEVRAEYGPSLLAARAEQARAKIRSRADVSKFLDKHGENVLRAICTSHCSAQPLTNRCQLVSKPDSFFKGTETWR
jgi:hypothetical protein